MTFTHMGRLAWLSCAVLVGSGCDPADEPHFRAASPGLLAVDEPGPEPRLPAGAPAAPVPTLAEELPERRIVLSPADLTTATYEDHPSIAVARRGLSTDEVSAIAERFSLVTWPERELVPTTPRYSDEGVENAVYSRLFLDPRVPLEDRWYALRGAVGDPAEFLPEAVNPRDGEYVVSRFHYGSNPIVRRIVSQVRAYDTGIADVQVLFSERVTIHGNPFVVERNGRAADCSLENGRDLVSDFGAPLVWLSCTGLAAGDSISVRTAEPLYATRGGLVTDASGSALDSTVASITDLAAAAPADDAERAITEEPERPRPPTVSTYVPDFGLPRTP